MKKFDAILYVLLGCIIFCVLRYFTDDEYSNSPYERTLELRIHYEKMIKANLLDTLVDEKSVSVTEQTIIQIKSTNQIPKIIKRTKVKNVNNGLIVDCWTDLCINRSSMESNWHPLFPRIPQYTFKMLKCGDDKKITGNRLRRIYGLLYTETSTFYDFKLLSRDGAELLFLDTKVPLKSANSVRDLNTLQEILYLKLSNEIMTNQDKTISVNGLYNIEKRNIWMEANNLYYIEILQAGKRSSMYEVQWRTQDSPYKIIGENNLIHTNSMSANSTPSMIYIKRKLAQRFPVNKYEERRISFHTIPNLRAEHKIKLSQFNCAKHEKKKKKITYLYEGFNQYIEFMLVYPKEFFKFTKFQQYSLRRLEYKTMDENRAQEIAHETFNKLNILFTSLLELQQIVHVTTNADKSYKLLAPHNTFHFVELDLKFKGEKKVYRTTHFVKSFPTGLCFMSDFEWQENVKINLLTPIRNQKHWLLYLIEMLEDLIEKTNETNIKLILIDNDSTDGDYQEILKSSKIKHTYLNLKHTFNKVKSLNFGLKHVTDENSIAMVMDLHLQLPLNMFDRVRKFTIQSITGFSPALMKLGYGEHEQYTDLKKSMWGDAGVGMMAMYKSDWTLIGGFNEKKFKKKWGGEDTEVIDRMVKHGLYLIHVRMPRFYHIYHSSAGMWDGKKPIQ